MRKIIVMPIGAVDRDELDSISSAVRESCQCLIELGESMAIPPDTYNVRRRQYNSTRILKALEVVNPEKEDILLAMIDKDLYVPELNFVFGEADLVSHIAIIGLPRLRQEFYSFDPDQELFVRRAAKEAIHELGHLEGLGHCPDSVCVMHFSNSMEDTDVKEAEICSNCRNQLTDLE